MYSSAFAETQNAFGKLPMRPFFRAVPSIGLTVVLTFSIGCPNASWKKGTEVGETFEAYADLPGLKASHHPGLQSELALLTSEQATPRQLDEVHATADPASVEVAAVLTTEFHNSAVELAASQTDKLFDAGEFQWDPINTQRAFQLRQQYDVPRQAVRRAMAQTKRHIQLNLSQGVGRSIEFVDAARIYNRMEMFLAAEQLVVGDLNAAIETTAAMLAMCELLGDQPHVVSRLAAGESRREVLQIVQAIAANSRCDASQTEQLRTLVEAQLTNWPSDSDAWIGDRAQGLHLYEMIRDGQLLSLLTEDELAQHSGGGNLNSFLAAATRSIDSDQHFYLRSMREIIAACDRPYSQREKVFDKLRTQLGELQKTPEYPLVADRMLLQNIEEAQRFQATDLAWTQAWANALTVSLEQRRPPYELNPLTGKPYQIYFENGDVKVSHIEQDGGIAKITIPLRRTEHAAHSGALPPPR